MIKLIHAADFHLDAPFSALPPERAAERRGELRQIPDRLADLAEEQGAQMVLLSGDLLDGDTYFETIQNLARALGRMQARVFIAPGNHDFWSARSPYSGTAWPENVHIFKSPAVEAVELPELNCTVYGAAFTGPYRDDSPLQGFRAPDDGRIHLMVLHGDMAGKASRYCPIDLEDAAASGLDYLALGHIHACSGVRRAESVYWAYPGCPEGRGFDELGDKGVFCGLVDSGRVDLDFVRLCQRRYEIKTVDLTGQEPGQALQSALPPSPTGDICRILLTGEYDEKGPDLAALEALAAPFYYSVALRDQTRARRDLWARAQEDTLTGLFLRQLRARLEAAQTEEDRILVEKAVRFGLAALENGEDCSP